jgi:hypothetical protein
MAARRASTLQDGGDPTLEEDAADQAASEKASVGERTRIIDRMKAALIRLGIRGQSRP